MIHTTTRTEITLILDTAGSSGSKDVIRCLPSPALSSAFFYDIIFPGFYRSRSLFSRLTLPTLSILQVETELLCSKFQPKSWVDSHWPQLVYVHLSEPIAMARGVDYMDWLGLAQGVLLWIWRWGSVPSNHMDWDWFTTGGEGMLDRQDSQKQN